MTQFTATEVRDEADFGGDLRLRHKMLYAYADRLEADEKIQAQRGVWVLVPREPTKAMIDAGCKIKLDRLEALRSGCEASSGIVSAVREEWEAMLAAAPHQAEEPFMYTWSKQPDKDGVFQKIPLYTHPQLAQDASKYQELLMAVEKKFPGESRHETALRYIRETELQSCEPKCDSSMAKESGNG